MSRSGGLEEGGESSSSPTVGLGFRDVQIESVHRPSPHGGAPSSGAQSSFDKDCRIRPTAAKPRPSTRRPRPSARPGGKAESGLLPGLGHRPYPSPPQSGSGSRTKVSYESAAVGKANCSAVSSAQLSTATTRSPGDFHSVPCGTTASAGACSLGISPPPRGACALDQDGVSMSTNP